MSDTDEFARTRNARASVSQAALAVRDQMGDEALLLHMCEAPDLFSRERIERGLSDVPEPFREDVLQEAALHAHALEQQRARDNLFTSLAAREQIIKDEISEYEGILSDDGRFREWNSLSGQGREYLEGYLRARRALLGDIRRIARVAFGVATARRAESRYNGIEGGHLDHVLHDVSRAESAVDNVSAPLKRVLAAEIVQEQQLADVRRELDALVSRHPTSVVEVSQMLRDYEGRRAMEARPAHRAVAL